MNKKDPKILQYLRQKKWAYTVTGDQYQIKICPFCGADDSKFYINAINGKHICWHSSCAVTGNMYSLKKELGDIQPINLAFSRKPISKEKYEKVVAAIDDFHDELLDDAEVLDYIDEKWNYDSYIVEEFKLGLDETGDGTKWLVIPYISNGRIVNAKFRSLPPAAKTFRRIKGMDSALLNVDSVNPELPYVSVCEGESDTINLIKLRFKNVVGVSVGARGIKPEWKDFFDNFEIIYLVYDPDEAGIDGARRMARRLGITKCRHVLIPPLEDGSIVDLTDYIKSGKNAKDIFQLYKSAKLFDIEDVVNMNHVMKDIENELFLHKTVDDGNFKTPWDNVNNLLGSFAGGDLIIVSGFAKIGKSTLALNLLLHYSMMGIPCFYYCLEMRPRRIGLKCISYLRLVERQDITRDDVVVVRAKFGNRPLYFGHSYSFTKEQIFDTIREAVARYGIEVVCFDHLHFLIRTITNVSAEVGAATRDFKLLAEELNIPILLIAQPKKVQGRARMTTNDLRDSSSIGQDGDTIVIVHRDRLPVKQDTKAKGGQLFSDRAEVIVDATRYNPGGVAELHFDGALSRYFLSKKDRLNHLRRR